MNYVYSNASEEEQIGWINDFERKVLGNPNTSEETKKLTSQILERSRKRVHKRMNPTNKEKAKAYARYKKNLEIKGKI